MARQIQARRMRPRRSVKARGEKRSRRFREPRSSSGGTLAPGRITGLSPNNYGFPDRLKTKLQYCDVLDLTAVAGTPALYQYRLSSLFDPDLTSIGHQPMWFDQLAAVYTRYRVLGAKITVTFIPPHVNDTEANDKGPYLVGITTSESSTFASTSYEALLENPNTTHAIIVDKQGANNKVDLSATYSPKRDLDIGPDDDLMNPLTTASPTRNFHATIWALDMVEAVAQDVVVKVNIEYTCQFSIPRTNIGS